MTGRFCGSCGAPVGPDTAFCSSCGTPVAAPSLGAPGEAGPWQAAPYGQPQAGMPYGQPQPGAPYGAPAQNGAPWGSGAPSSGGSAVAASGRSAIDALLTGDWGGAARAAGFAVLAMLGLSLVGVLLLGGGEVGAREILALTTGAVCTAVGGDIFVETSAGDFFDSSASFGLLPLTLTLTGLTLLGWLFVRSLRARDVHGARDVLLQGVRTALVFSGCFLVLSLLTRYRTDGSDELLGLTGRIGVSVWSTLIGALLFAVATLGLVWLFSRQTRAGLPRRLAAIRAQVVAPLVGTVVVFGAGLLGVFGAFVYGLIQLDERVAQFGVLVLGGGNGMLASILWSAGVPLNADAGVSGDLVGELAEAGLAPGDSIDLFTFTDANGWFWLAPVALLLVLLAVATVLTLRQNSVEDARREGFRFAGALAVVAFAAALLLRISTGVEGGAGQFGGSANASATFNPVVAAFALAIWGVVAGLLGPVIATKVSVNFVTTVRGRFGAVPPRPVAPAPTGPVGQGWQQPATQQFGQPPYPQQPGVGQPPYPQQPSYEEQPHPLPPVPPLTQ